MWLKECISKKLDASNFKDAYLENSEAMQFLVERLTQNLLPTKNIDSEGVTLEFIQNGRMAIPYLEAGIWPKDLTTPDIVNILPEGLYRKSVGYLPIGLKIEDRAAAISVFSRRSPDDQHEQAVFVPDGPLSDKSTILTLRFLDDFSQGRHLLEIGETQLSKFGNSSLGLWTPLRRIPSLLESILLLAKELIKEFPNDWLLIGAQGMLQTSNELELQIVRDIGDGGSITVGEYLNKYCFYFDGISDASKILGLVRPLSRTTRSFIERSGLGFQIVGYTVDDFSWVCLSKLDRY